MTVVLDIPNAFEDKDTVNVTFTQELLFCGVCHWANYTRNHTIKSSPIRQWVLFPIGCWFLTVNGQLPRRIGPFSRALREADER